MKNPIRAVLHNFAINYRIESKETRNQDIDQALTSLATIVEKMRKQVRYEDVKRQMGRDGVIIETEKNIRYDKEDEAYNQAISDLVKLIKGKE